MPGLIVLGIVIALLAVLVIRAAAFRPKKQPSMEYESVSFDKDAAIDALQKLVQCKTISYNDKALEDDAEFQKLIDLLPSLYPQVFQVCSFTQLARQNRRQSRCDDGSLRCSSRGRRKMG